MELSVERFENGISFWNGSKDGTHLFGKTISILVYDLNPTK